jgi:hypothetical protein
MRRALRRTLRSCVDRIEVRSENLGSMKIVGVDPLVIGCGISQPMYQVLSLPTYILVVQDLFDLVLILVIWECGAWSCRLSFGE